MGWHLFEATLFRLEYGGLEKCTLTQVESVGFPHERKQSVTKYQSNMMGGFHLRFSTIDLNVTG